METFESVMLGIIAVVVMLFFFPGMKQRLKDSPKGSAEDWKGLLFPLIMVVLFVMFLISVV